jgi:hypothetical protein
LIYLDTHTTPCVLFASNVVLLYFYSGSMIPEEIALTYSSLRLRHLNIDEAHSPVLIFRIQQVLRIILLISYSSYGQFASNHHFTMASHLNFQ